LTEAPTATQAVEVQDTPVKKLREAPPGLGVCWSFQLVPFHTSANVRPENSLSSD
jgi:hypothetical protein